MFQLKCHGLAAQKRSAKPFWVDMQFSGQHFPGIPACRHEGGREARSGRQYMLFCLVWAESLEFLG